MDLQSGSAAPGAALMTLRRLAVGLLLLGGVLMLVAVFLPWFDVHGEPALSSVHGNRINGTDAAVDAVLLLVLGGAAATLGLTAAATVKAWMKGGAALLLLGSVVALLGSLTMRQAIAEAAHGGRFASGATLAALPGIQMVAVAAIALAAGCLVLLLVPVSRRAAVAAPAFEVPDWERPRSGAQGTAGHGAATARAASTGSPDRPGGQIDAAPHAAPATPARSGRAPAGHAVTAAALPFEDFARATMPTDDADAPPPAPRTSLDAPALSFPVLDRPTAQHRDRTAPPPLFSVDPLSGKVLRGPWPDRPAEGTADPGDAGTTPGSPPGDVRLGDPPRTPDRPPVSDRPPGSDRPTVSEPPAGAEPPPGTSPTTRRDP